jgi:hypothetical protein
MHQKVSLISMVLALFFCLILSPRIEAQNTTNAQQAQAMFNRTFQMVFGPQGSSLHYDVNIIGIYKTTGDISYKGKKMKYMESRYASWNDGVTAYMVDRKKKTVNIFKAESDKKDNYLSKFKYNLSDFKYSWKRAPEGYLITINVKNAGLTGIREVIGLIDSNTYYPISLRIRVAFFWTTVKISDFKSGNLSDQVFDFPYSYFKSYKFTDKRNEN